MPRPDAAAGPPLFGALVARHRRAAGLTQEQLAERAGLSVRGLSDLERGLRRTPQRETVRLLADALELSPRDRAALQTAARGDDAPPPRRAAPGAPPLPVPLTALLGREHEAAAVIALLRQAQARLVTLTGPGGVGKTRLALRAAAELVPAFPDGVWFIDLSPLTDPALVLSTIARALAMVETGGDQAPLRLVAQLRRKRLLLLLDNFEQVLAAAQQVAALLAACPGLTVLVTSRAALRLSGEHEYPLPPLAVPAPDPPPPLDQLLHYAAVALFVARARAVRPDFRVTEETASAVAAICRRVDGLPLAIELAAARARLLPPPALLARLERSLPLLTGGGRDLPPRQQALRATIAWSYDLLDAGAQRLLRRLAAFAGGWTVAAAEAVCAADGDPPGAVLDGLDGLLGQSLVRPAGGGAGEARLGMLETIREFAQEQLRAQGEEAHVRGRHAAYFLALAEEAAPQLGGVRQAAWLARLEEEHDNLRAALGWALERGEAETAQRLVWALWRFWWWRGHLGEGWRWAEAALAQGTGAPADLRARVGAVLGHFLWLHGEHARLQLLDEAQLPHARAAGDSWALGATLFRLGVALAQRGGAADALRAEGLAVARATADPWVRGYLLLLNGILARHAADYATATALLGESLATCRRAGDPLGEAAALANLGLVALLRGEPARARARFAESLPLSQRVGDVWGIANALANVAALASLEGRPRDAARLYGAADALRERVGAPTPAVDRALHEQQRAAARARLGEAGWADAWAEGHGLAPDEAVALALAPADTTSAATLPPGPP